MDAKTNNEDLAFDDLVKQNNLVRDNVSLCRQQEVEPLLKVLAKLVGIPHAKQYDGIFLDAEYQYNRVNKIFKETLKPNK